jgi:hypothetical protein
MYKWDGMIKISYTLAVKRFGFNKHVYKLYDDDTEALANSLEDITEHINNGGELGYEPTDIELESLWVDLEDVTMYEDEEGILRLCSEWLHFEKGTDQDTIWKWFDKYYSKGVGWLYENIEI